MHLHMFPLLKMFCQTMKFFHRLKMRKNKVSLLLPKNRRLPEIMVPRSQYRHVYADFQQGLEPKGPKQYTVDNDVQW